MPELKLKDVTLHYEIDDFTDPWLENPEAVLLHHGCGKHSGFWYRWVPVLARKYVVIRIDARGFGKSSDPGPDFKWSIKAFADDVASLLDHLEIPQVNFVGEFMGAWTGIEFALDYPDRIKKLVFSCLPYFYFDAKSAVDSINRIGIKGDQLMGGGGQLRFGRDKVFERWFTEETEKTNPRIITSVMQAAGNIDYRNQLSEIKCPALVILSEGFVKKHNGEPDVALMREKLSGSSEVLVLKGVPQFVVYTRPEMCAKLSMKFFEKGK